MIFLSDDFERGVDGDAVGGSWTVAAGAATISTDYVYAGTRSCQNNGIMEIPLTHLDNSYSVSFWIYKKAACTHVAIGHGDGVHSVIVYIYTDGSINYINLANVTVDTGIDISLDSWQLIEINNINFTTTTFDLWLNGIKLFDDLQMATNAGQVNLVYLRNVDTAHDIYIDNFMVKSLGEVICKPSKANYYTTQEHDLTFYNTKEAIPKYYDTEAAE